MSSTYKVKDPDLVPTSVRCNLAHAEPASACQHEDYLRSPSLSIHVGAADEGPGIGVKQTLKEFGAGVRVAVGGLGRGAIKAMTAPLVGPAPASSRRPSLTRRPSAAASPRLLRCAASTDSTVPISLCTLQIQFTTTTDPSPEPSKSAYCPRGFGALLCSHFAVSNVDI